MSNAHRALAEGDLMYRRHDDTRRVVQLPAEQLLPLVAKCWPKQYLQGDASACKEVRL